MEEFKKELDDLLVKYPHLPEFTMIVRPRVSITIVSHEEKIGMIPVTPINKIAIPLQHPQILPGIKTPTSDRIEEMKSMMEIK